MTLSQEQINKVREQIGFTPAAKNNAVETVAKMRQIASQFDAQKQQSRQPVGGGYSGRAEAMKPFWERIASGIKQKFTRRVNTAVQAGEAYVSSDPSKKQSFARTFGQVTGQIPAFGGDVVFEVIKSAFNQLPEETQSKIKGSANKIIGDITEASIRKHEQMKIEEPEKAAEVQKLVDDLELIAGEVEADPRLQRDLEAVGGFTELLGLNIGKRMAGEAVDVVSEVAEAGLKSAGKKVAETTADIARKSKQFIADTSKPVIERIKNVRQAVPDVTEAKKARLFSRARFTENPAVSGAVDDIKIMVGLPESTPSVDLTFRAIKPRLTKNVDLRRVKSQMELANQTIVENGLKPTSVREYADAVYDTKKKVWSEIEASLQAGAKEGTEVDLKPIVKQILDMAEEPALGRINPGASKQLVEIAENLIKNGDKVSVLEAERMKQLLNAELEGLFGEMNISKQAKEAKKLITREIGTQLDEILSELPGEFKDLKIKYGSLSAIEDDILKRAIVFERQNPEGLADILTKTEAAAELVFGNTKGRLRAVARLTMGQRLKKANDANEMVKRAFEKLSNESDFNTPAMGKIVPEAKKGLLKADDTLLKEAKKYKSAEEFVGAQKSVFRGESGATSELKGKAIYTSPDKELARTYGNTKESFILGGKEAKITDKKLLRDFIGEENYNKGKTIFNSFDEVKQDKLLKEKLSGLKRGELTQKQEKLLDDYLFVENPTFLDIDARQVSLQDFLRKNGFDYYSNETYQGIMGKSAVGRKPEIVVLNKDILKTKSQLTDIYNKAHKTK